MQKSTEGVLRKVDETLYTAELGFKLLKGTKPQERMAGLRNLIVFGRAVTNVLQNLRNSEGIEKFDEWYLPKMEEMKNDKVMKFFYQLRTEILKEGTLDTSSSVTLSGNPSALMQQHKAPPGAKGFFIGDSIGGCGWEVEIEPGKTEMYYVDVPENVPGLKVNVDVIFLNSPVELAQKNAEELSRYYLDYLSNLIGEAKKHFTAQN